MTSLLTKRELARALQSALVLLERREHGRATLPSLRLAVKATHDRRVREGIVPERLWAAELREMEATECNVIGGVAHVWRECPCKECAFERDLHARLLQRKASGE